MDPSDIYFVQDRYFFDGLNLFDEFQWLIKYPVTEILIKNLLNEIPDNWLNVLRELNYNQLNKFAMGTFIRSDWPPTLISFLERCKHLNKLSQLSETTKKKSRTLPINLSHGLSLKKQHEVSHFVDFIHEKCQSENIKTIVDFGSGLGYICQALHHLYGYRVIGLECNNDIYNNACKRQLEFFPESCINVKYYCRKINFDNADDIEFIENIISSGVNANEKICLIGLHSCGDLGLTSASLFQRINQSKLLIMISCCYHKLEIADNNEIIRFGVCESLRRSIMNYNEKILKLKYDIRNIFNRPFMRLASQEPASRWDNMSDYNHLQHAFCVLARGVIELFAHENNITLKKCVKKATRKSQCSNFDMYLTDALQRYTFNGINESMNKVIIEKIKNMWNTYKDRVQDIEIFTALQLLLQAPAESFVLEDRRCHLQELSHCGMMNITTDIITVFDSKISPRCHAIVAHVNKSKQ